ncbi:hypothetical protein B0H14DRAFT_2559195 [Mycena olivaceomarginata]|nr:hypothetical protein B0H14DRAFT_2559195 [Mycena olivaceomarginata]
MTKRSTLTVCVRKIDPPIVLEVLNRPDLGVIVDILFRAFSTDPFTAIVTGHQPYCTEPNPLVKILCRSSAVPGLLGGEVYVAEISDPKPEIVGDQVQLTLQPLIASFSNELKQWWNDFLPSYIKHTNIALGEGEELASWCLQKIAVNPKYQRKGVTTLLAGAGIKKAAITKTPLWVDCSEETNVEVYQRLGFELMPKRKGDLHGCRRDFTAISNGKPMFSHS